MRTIRPIIVTMDGDVVGPSNANVVDKWQRKSLSGFGAPLDGQVPVFSTANNRWELGTPAGGGVIETGTLDPRGVLERDFGALYQWETTGPGDSEFRLMVQTMNGPLATRVVWQNVWQVLGQSEFANRIIGSGALPGTLYTIEQSQEIVPVDLASGAATITVDTSLWPNGQSEWGDTFGFVNDTASSSNIVEVRMLGGDQFVDPVTGNLVTSAQFRGAGRRVVWTRGVNAGGAGSNKWQVVTSTGFDATAPTGLTKRETVWTVSNDFAAPTDHGSFLVQDGYTPVADVNEIGAAINVPYAGSVTEIIFSRADGGTFPPPIVGIEVFKVTRGDPLVGVSEESQTTSASVNNGQNVLTYSANSFAATDMIGFKFLDADLAVASGVVRVTVKYEEA